MELNKVTIANLTDNYDLKDSDSSTVMELFNQAREIQIKRSKSFCLKYIQDKKFKGV